jgi:hypothetical protein
MRSHFCVRMKVRDLFYASLAIWQIRGVHTQGVVHCDAELGVTIDHRDCVQNGLFSSRFSQFEYIYTPLPFSRESQSSATRFPQSWSVRSCAMVVDLAGDTGVPIQASFGQIRDGFSMIMDECVISGGIGGWFSVNELIFVMHNPQSIAGHRECLESPNVGIAGVRGDMRLDMEECLQNLSIANNLPHHASSGFAPSVVPVSYSHMISHFPPFVPGSFAPYAQQVHQGQHELREQRLDIPNMVSLVRPHPSEPETRSVASVTVHFTYPYYSPKGFQEGYLLRFFKKGGEIVPSWLWIGTEWTPEPKVWRKWLARHPTEGAWQVIELKMNVRDRSHFPPSMPSAAGPPISSIVQQPYRAPAMYSCWIWKAVGTNWVPYHGPLPNWRTPEYLVNLTPPGWYLIKFADRMAILQ